MIGTVSAGEFLVSVGASIGFLIALPWHQIDPALVGALLVGGGVAAPFAALADPAHRPAHLGHGDRRLHRGHQHPHPGGGRRRAAVDTGRGSVGLATAWVVTALRVAVMARRASLALQRPAA